MTGHFPHSKRLERSISVDRLERLELKMKARGRFLMRGRRASLLRRDQEPHGNESPRRPIRSHRSHDQRHRRNRQILRAGVSVLKEKFLKDRTECRATHCASASRKPIFRTAPPMSRTRAQTPIFGSADVCLIAAVPLDEVLPHVCGENISIVGPVSRKGAIGLMRSVYVHDPDGNLVEVSE